MFAQCRDSVKDAKETSVKRLFWKTWKSVSWMAMYLDTEENNQSGPSFMVNNWDSLNVQGPRQVFTMSILTEVLV